MLDDDYFKDLEFLEPNIIDLGEIDFNEIKKSLFIKNTLNSKEI